jgi:hypothetical protein
MTRARLLAQAGVMLAVAAALLSGLATGLARLGWDIDLPVPDWRAIHGPLMVCAFLGTLISLERAAALSGLSPHLRHAYAVPLVSAAGGVALLLPGGIDAARVLFVMAGAGLALLAVVMRRRHPSPDVAVMGVGAVCWLIGNALWLGGRPLFEVVHWWAAFLILTIVGERLELSRVMRHTAARRRMLLLAVGIYMGGVLLTRIDIDAGIRLAGIGQIGMAAWLLRFDVARRTVRQDGLPQYIAFCLLAGYVWLAAGGGLGLWQGAVYAGPEYEAYLHALLLGFVFSMIFGHAPIIIPALTGLPVRFSPLFYTHLTLLHTALIYRLYGDLWLDVTAMRRGGLLNVAAVLLFMAVTAAVVARGSLTSRRAGPS